jgi:small subunit ribosomal protein S1
MNEENKIINPENPQQEIEQQENTPDVNNEQAVDNTQNESTEELNEVTSEPTAEPIAKEEVVEAPQKEEEIESIELVATDSVEAKEPVEEVKQAVKEVSAKRERPQDFDWDALDVKETQFASAADRDKLESLYDGTLNQITDLQVVEGEILGFGDREVFINIGYKSDGVIALSEVRYNPDIKIGDKIDVYIESQEDTLGQLVLSHKKARLLKSWDKVVEVHEKDEVINGFVKCRTKGGFIVDVFGIEAFLPGSQIDVKPIRDYDVFVNKTMELKVVKINHEFKNVVVSHKVLIEDELEQQKADIIAKLEKGQVLEGTVKNITSYGVFIDLGGVDGLIHITDLSWGRINHPEEVVQLDEVINVVILDFDENKKRIALGLKQLTAHPWDSLDAELKVGDKVKGKVVVIADYGAFIEITPGVEGLIHVSEMSWSQHLRSAQDFLKVGDEVEAIILTLDREERKMSLGIKQLIPDPWTNIKEKYPVNSKHKATVRNFTNFGVFVELEEGVDGLIHISDLSWSKKIKHPAEFTKIGEEIEVVVLDTDVENRRLSLGHKQLEENPWDVFESLFTEGSVHKATVVEVMDKGATIALPYGVEGFVPIKHLGKEDNTNVKADETADFMVIEFSKENRKIVLSHTRIWKEKKDEEQQTEKAVRKTAAQKTTKSVKTIQDKIEKATLGDLEVLANLKTDMESAEKETSKTKKTKKEDTEENTDE